MKLSQIIPCHLRWSTVGRALQSPDPPLVWAFWGQRGIFQMPLIFGMQHATLRGWHCWEGGVLKCLVLFYFPLYWLDGW